MKTTLLNLPQKDCLVVYKEIFKNSEAKWHSGQIIAEQKDYATAIALMTFSIEELIKSIIILLDGRGLKLRTVNGIHSFFRNHEIRYTLALFFSFIKACEPVLAGLFTTNPEKLSHIAEGRNVNLQKVIIDYALNNKYKVRRLSVIMRNEFIFFAKLDSIRQNSIYCNYDGELLTPLSLTQPGYKEIYIKLASAREVGLGMIQMFSSDDEETKNFCKMVYDGFIVNNFHELLNDAFSKMKENRMRPFEQMKFYFESIFTDNQASTVIIEEGSL